MLMRARKGSSPRPEVELACGSRSTRSTEWPISASAAPRLMAVVVLPTPPFWVTTAMIGETVVDNILGSMASTDAISGAMRRILTQLTGRAQAGLQGAAGRLWGRRFAQSA